MICTTSASERGCCLNQIDPPIPDDFQPVGRLDQHSHGLLLFSVDGRLTSALLSPRTSIERTYRIIVKGDVGTSSSGDGQSGRYEEICNIVETGVQTDYGIFKGRIVSMERDVNNNYEHSKCGTFCGGKRNDTFNGIMAKSDKDDAEDSDTSCILSAITVAVKEGKKRMVRRLFAAICLFVVDLKRLRYGDVELCENLPTGQWRYSSNVETQYCKEIIKNWEREGSGWNL